MRENFKEELRSCLATRLSVRTALSVYPSVSSLSLSLLNHYLSFLITLSVPVSLFSSLSLPLPLFPAYVTLSFSIFITLLYALFLSLHHHICTFISSILSSPSHLSNVAPLCLSLFPSVSFEVSFCFTVKTQRHLQMKENSWYRQ